MKKFGFTLAEVLISLTIIGVVAAMVAPTISKITPNKDKVMVIKAYKALSDTCRLLINEPGFYLNAATAGFEDTEVPYIPEYNDETKYSGNNKFCNLLMDNMHTYSKTASSNGTGSWTTVDFLSWKCEYSSGTAKITLDIDDENSDSCYYSSTCKSPDLYLFNVSKYGIVTAHDDDKLTQVYLKNMERLNDKKADFAELD